MRNDGGQSTRGATVLRDRLSTPLLRTELVRGLEPTAGHATAGVTDFLRADVAWTVGSPVK